MMQRSKQRTKGLKISKRPPLPTLIAFPLPQMEPPERERLNPNPDIFVPPGMFEAGDALSAVICLILTFIDDDESYKHVAEWLEYIDDTIGNIEKSIAEEWFDEHPTDQSENIDTLRELAWNPPDIESESDSPVAMRALSIWIEEVVRRTHELCDICIRSINGLEADRIYKDLRKLRYPFY